MLMSVSLAVAQDVEHSYFFIFMGIVSAVVFANLGAAFGTAKSAIGIVSMGVLRPNLIFKALMPAIMSGVLGMYGLIIAFLINREVKENFKPSFQVGYKFLAAGLCCGLSSLAAGLCIGIVGDAGTRAYGQQEKIFQGLLLMLIFGEAIALYGVIIALMMVTQDNKKD